MSWSSNGSESDRPEAATASADALPPPSSKGGRGLRQMGRHSLVYAAGIVLGKLAGFIMLPVYTRYLTPADYGVLELMGMTIDVIGMVAGIGLASSIFKFYSDADTETEKNKVVGTAALSAVGLAGVTTLLGLLVAPLLARHVVGEHGSVTFFRLFFVVFFLQNFSYVPLMLMRAQGRSQLFVTTNIAKLIVNLSLNIVFVVHLRMGVMGVLVSNVITEFALALVLTTYLVRAVGLRFSVEKFRAMARFGNPMVVWSLCNFIVVFSDRIFLNHYTSTAAVGVYSLGYKFAFILTSLAYAPFRQVWDVQRFEISKRPDAQKVYARAFVYMNLTVGPAALAISLFVKDFLTVMSSPAFHSAYQVVPILLAAQILFAWVSFCNLGLLIKSKTGMMALVGVGGACATMLFNLLLIPTFGVMGAAAATLAAYAVRFGWLYSMSQRHYPVRYPWATVARLYSIIGAAVLVRFMVHPEGLGASVAWSAVLLVSALAVVYFSVLGPTEYQLIHASLARLRFRPAVRSKG